jgi:hypothetical protein
MENNSKAKAAFNQRLKILQKESVPALTDNNLKDIVVYEKLLDIQEQISILEKKFEKI